jgi:hypothetical protein
VVRDHADVFEQAPPRSWTYASDLLHVLRPEERTNTELLRLALRGHLPASWATLVAESMSKYPALPELDMEKLLGTGGDAVLSKMVGDFDGARRSDVVTMIATELRRQFAGPALRARVDTGAVTLASLEKLLAPLPGDLREQCLDSAVESASGPSLLRQLGYDAAGIAANYGGSPLRAETLSWLREMKLHRVRLVAACVTRWLEETRGERLSRDGAAAHLALLAGDAGPCGQDLSRWLGVRGLLPEKKTPV